MSDAMLAQQHPVETWGALTASLGLVGTLVAVLYYRLNKDISAHERKLDEGNKAFADIGNRLVALGEKIANIQTGDVFTDEEFDRLDADIKDLTKRLTVLETEHNGCIPRQLALRGKLGD